MEKDPIIQLAKELISIPSISPDQSGAQTLLINRLVKLGFVVEELELNGARNFWAKLGSKAPLFVFSGHTDVVAPGEESKWTSPPFEPAIRNTNMFGRGAADMKGSVAAMITAVETFLKDNTQTLPFSLGFLITGDEELGGPAAKAFLEHLTAHNQKIDYCLVGEPSSETRLGDTIKIGRRGYLSGRVEFIGKQGHVGYPHLADNALHRAFKPLLELSQMQFIDGGEYFQPTTFQITTLNGGVAANVIPGEAAATFNFRFSLYNSADALKARVEEILKGFDGLNYKLSWKLHGDPYLTPHGNLTKAVTETVKDAIGVMPAFSTAGGTSDGRFFAKTGAEVIELGPVNKSIHQIDEHVSVSELIKLSELYKNILVNLAKILSA